MAGKIERILMFGNIYANKRVLVTGHTGFKGSWLSLWLTLLGANVCGFSLEPDTKPSIFNTLNLEQKIYSSNIGDICEYNVLSDTINKFKPDIVFHLAAQPLVRKSYHEPILTYKTNVMGTLNVLEAASKCGTVRAFINVTTDKCYLNKETNIGYKEDDKLGGYDMYSSSKACSEILSTSFRHSFLQNDNSMLLATVRAGNVIGGGDWALDRLIPDCIKSINANMPIEIRNPNSIRPWQYVLEPLSGYLLLGQKLLENKKEFAESFNFGPQECDSISVLEIADKICKNYGKGKIIQQRHDNLHEAGLLMLNTDKAQKELGWQPVYDINTALKETVEWYKYFYQKNMDMFEYTVKQIKKYEGNIKWNKT